MIISVFSFDPHNNSAEVNKKGLVMPFYRRGNEGKERLSDLLKLIKLEWELSFTLCLWAQ